VRPGPFTFSVFQTWPGPYTTLLTTIKRYPGHATIGLALEMVNFMKYLRVETFDESFIFRCLQINFHKFV